MADFPRLEYQGRSECPKCRAPSAEEYRVQDYRGRRVGRLVRRIRCRCYSGLGEVVGSIISEVEHFDPRVREG